MTQPNNDHDPTSDPPGAVSDQNGEEAQSGHREDGTHPEPRTSGKEPDEHAERGSHEPSTGAAGEGSQSTGHRHNAG
jgi:hypothetical protein